MSPTTRSAVYEIRVAGTVDRDLADELTDLEVLRIDGETVLRGPMRDEAELQGLLHRLRARGARLVEVRRLA